MARKRGRRPAALPTTPVDATHVEQPDSGVSGQAKMASQSQGPTVSMELGLEFGDFGTESQGGAVDGDLSTTTLNPADEAPFPTMTTGHQVAEERGVPPQENAMEPNVITAQVSGPQSGTIPFALIDYSRKDKYLVAEEDRLTITQGRDGSSENAVWIVEFVEGKDCVRLKSCFGTYLTASNTPFVPGVTGKKVIQTRPCQSDPATEWEPLRDGMQVRLRSLWGNFLRPHGSLPPWRNSVTHDIPHLSKTYEKVLWAVEVVEKCTDCPRARLDSEFTRSRSFSALSGSPMKQRENARRVLLDDQMTSHRYFNKVKHVVSGTRNATVVFFTPILESCYIGGKL
ncbi:hypothetical protein BUALT_Bualt04G0064300 [Buddleja alternifolia]|uniref:DUF569 domain-containing protein n=1 Tax=Buddleja alternifolia TaxID=168488 RepID=A0AAV6XLS2_9LAMI|nr:hypothetical protein BUALT_Bualt04G0064300 [Buddleja alternifolia]